MDAQVLREFLVALSYKVDGGGERRFNDSLKASAKWAAGLGVTLSALVASAVAASSAMEKLFFFAQRNNAAVGNVRALQYALANLGGSAEGALSSIEGVAKFIRSNPGGEGWISALGVQTRDANGALRDTTDILGDLGKQFANMPYYQALKRGQLLGIDEVTLQALIKGVGEFGADYKRMAASLGYDNEQAAKSSHDFMIQLRALWTDLDLVGKKFGTTFADKLMPLIAQARRWIENNGALISRAIDVIVTWLGIFGKAVATIVTRAIEIFAKLYHGFQNLSPATQELIKWIVGLTVAIKAMNVAWNLSPIGRIIALGAALLLLYDDYQTWKEGGESLIDWKQWTSEIAIVDGAIKGLIDTLQSLAKAYDDIRGFLGKNAAQKAFAISQGTDSGHGYSKGSKIHGVYEDIAYMFGYDPRTGKKIEEGAPARPAGSSSLPIGLRNNNPGNLRTGPGGSFGSYASPADGLVALGKQLNLYATGASKAAGNRRLTTVQDILSVYAPPSENDTGAYVNSVAKGLGVKPTDQLDLSDPEVMAGLMRGIVKHENGQNPYSDAMIRGAAQQAIGGSPSMEVNNTFNINGAKDPKAVGADVQNRQTDVNQKLARNFTQAAT